MSTIVEKLHAELSELPCASNIACFLLYGSLFKKHRFDVKDTDIIVVVHDISVKMDALFDFIFNQFHNPDFHIYTVREVEENCAYFTREYILEYLAKGDCLYGENIFQEKFKEVTKRQYKESIFIRSIEHMQMGRKVYFSRKYDNEYKIAYLKKYSIRLAKNILLFKGVSDYDTLDMLSSNQVLEMLKQRNFLDKEYFIAESTSVPLEYYYELFCAVSVNLLACRTELAMLDINENHTLAFSAG